MPLTVDDLKDLARRATSCEAEPTPADPAEVLPHLDDPDRNVRVAALRVLAWCDGPAAVDGILRGLDDEKKRVREVAAKSSARFVGDERVVARLRRAVEDDETGSARPALQVLGGSYTLPYGLASLEPVASALAALAEQPRFRRQALLALVRARRLTPELTGLLRSFVRDGDKEEAVLATRRLDGFRVAHTGELGAGVEAQTEPAWGDVWRWVRVPD